MLYKSDKLFALLPASVKENVVVSHGGLTYAGFVTGAKMSGALMLEMFSAYTEHLKGMGCKEFVYKAMPPIYNSLPAQEDLYAIHRLGGEIAQRHLSTTIDYRNPGPLQERRKRGIKKAEKLGYQLIESNKYEEFWSILTENLNQRHGTDPTHSLKEIIYLRDLFPGNIVCFGS